jgi:hypothetical protein
MKSKICYFISVYVYVWVCWGYSIWFWLDNYKYEKVNENNIRYQLVLELAYDYDW